jgi:hypothetical protein
VRQFPTVIRVAGQRRDARRAEAAAAFGHQRALLAFENFRLPNEIALLGVDARLVAPGKRHRKHHAGDGEADRHVQQRETKLFLAPPHPDHALNLITTRARSNYLLAVEKIPRRTLPPCISFRLWYRLSV